jgi:hypothetical protein
VTDRPDVDDIAFISLLLTLRVDASLAREYVRLLLGDVGVKGGMVLFDVQVRP